MADFTIPETIYDKHEWISDYFINGPMGSNCKLIYEATQESCDNCTLDNDTNRSSNIYNGTGPIPFLYFSLPSFIPDPKLVNSLL